MKTILLMHPKTSTYPPPHVCFRKATGILDRLLSFIALLILALVLFPVVILYAIMLVTVGAAMAAVNLWELAKLAEVRATTLAVCILIASAICASAAPLPPFPTTIVKRPAPLLSPKAASAPKSTPMFKVASVNPPVPMMVEVAPASEGRVTLLVDAYKPANTPMTFEYAPTSSGPWSFLQYWGTYPEAQWVGVAWTTGLHPLYVRATHESGTGGSMSPASAVAPRVAPEGVVRLPPSKRKPTRLQ